MQKVLKLQKDNMEKPRLLQDKTAADAISKLNSPNVPEPIRRTISDLLYKTYDSELLLEAFNYLAEHGENLLTRADVFFNKIRSEHTDQEVAYAVSFMERMLQPVILTEVENEPGNVRKLLGMQGLEGIREPNEPPIVFFHRFDERGRKWETMWIEPWKLALYYIDQILEDIPDDEKVDKIIQAAEKTDEVHFKYMKQWKDNGIWGK